MPKMTGTLTPAEIKAVFKAAMKIGNRRSKTKSFFSRLNPDQPRTDRKQFRQDTLYKLWRQNYEPTKVADIKELLLDYGLTEKEVEMAFKEAEVNPDTRSDPRIAELSKLAKTLGIEAEVMKLIDKELQTVKESTLVERQLSDKEIKEIFKLLIQKAGKNPGNESPSNASSNTLRTYVKNWTDQILSSSASKEEKIQLAKEVVNTLADRFNTAEWQEVVKSVEKVLKRAELDPSFKTSALGNLKNGKIMEKNAYILSTLLLHDCGLTWLDLNVRPVKLQENQIGLYATFGNKNVLMEDIFIDLLNFNKLHKLKPMREKKK